MADLTPWQQALLYENRANPYPFYATLRKTPVSRQPDGTYVVSTYREIVSILHDPRVSSDLRKRPDAPSAAAEAASSPTSMYDREPSMITSDPPEHDRVRRATMRHFGPPHTPDLVSSQEDGIKRIVTDLLDKLKGKTRIDVVDEFAYPLPVSVICSVLGVPEEDEKRFHNWIEAALNGLDLGPEATSEEGQHLAKLGHQARQELSTYMAELLERYAKQPGLGMLSAMVNSADERLSRGELLSNAQLLLFAGHETTVNLIAHSILTLLRHPHVLEELRRRPELIVPGVEEFLRFESSVQFWPTRTGPEFGPPLGRVMTGQDNVWNRSRDVRIRELSRHRLHLRPVVARRWRWEWGRALDLRRVMFQPLAVVEGDRRDNAAAVAVSGGETPFLDGTLGENDLVAERTDAH